MAAVVEASRYRDYAFPLAIAVSSGLGAAASRSPSAALIAVACMAAAPILWCAFAAPVRWPLLFCAAAILSPPVSIGGFQAHPAIIVAAAGVLGGLANLNRWSIRSTALNFSLGAVLASSGMSLGFAALYSGWLIAAGSAARWLLLAAAIYVYFTSSQGPGHRHAAQADTTARWLFWIALAAALFGCIDFLYQLPAPAGFGAQFIWLDSGVYRRAQGFFYDASALGNLCALFVVMSVAALMSKKILPRPVSALGLVVFLAALLLSYSRGALGAAAIGCLALLLLDCKTWGKRRIVIAVATLVAITGAAFALVLPEFASTYIARFSFSSGAGATPERFFSGRLETWRAAAAFLAAHPWELVFGIGYKTLPYTRHLGRPLIADNMYLSTLMETGLFGLLALLALNIAILRAGFRGARRGSFFGKWIFCFWLGEMFHMFLADVLTFWRVLPVFFWVLAQVMNEDTPG